MEACELQHKIEGAQIPHDYFEVMVYHVMRILLDRQDLHSSYLYMATNIKLIETSCFHRSPSRNYMCASIHSIEWKGMNLWRIKGLGGYNMNLVMKVFRLMYSTGCKTNRLDIIKVMHCNHSEAYCGHLPLWHETCPCREVHLSFVLHCLSCQAEFNLVYYVSRSRQLPFFSKARAFLPKLFKTFTWVSNEIYSSPQLIYLHYRVLQHEIIKVSINISHSRANQPGEHLKQVTD